jgi:hypothetical protein
MAESRDRWTSGPVIQRFMGRWSPWELSYSRSAPQRKPGTNRYPTELVSLYYLKARRAVLE